MTTIMKLQKTQTLSPANVAVICMNIIQNPQKSRKVASTSARNVGTGQKILLTINKKKQDETKNKKEKKKI